MKTSKRRTFQSDGYYVNETVAVHRFLRSPRNEVQRVKKSWTYDQALEAVLDFINSIGPDRVITVNEYTQSLEYKGDDNRTVWSVFYWEEDNAHPQA